MLAGMVSKKLRGFQGEPLKGLSGGQPTASKGLCEGPRQRNKTEVVDDASSHNSSLFIHFSFLFD